jgi:hypothetical protein
MDSGPQEDPTRIGAPYPVLGDDAPGLGTDIFMLPVPPEAAAQEAKRRRLRNTMIVLGGLLILAVAAVVIVIISASVFSNAA